jgi:hypothetical protein
MAGYTRQTTFVDAATIEAADHNSELNAVQAAFANTTGHAHDGTAAEGPVIGLIGDAGVTTPLNKVLIDTANDNIGFWVDVASSSVEQIIITDGTIEPVTDSDIDLGTNTKRFKDLYADTITLTTAVPVAQGGTGATSAGDARTNLGVDAAGTDNSTDVTLAGTPDYITISGQEITRNQIDLTTDVTGVLPSGNGGSQIKVGHTTMTAATGNQAVTGIGFQPTWIMAVNVMTASASEITTACGYYEDSTYYQRSRTAYNNGSTVAFWNAVDSTSLYNVYDSGAVNLARGTIASFDADGFTINKSFGQMVVDVFWIVGT